MKDYFLNKQKFFIIPNLRKNNYNKALKMNIFQF